MHSAQSTIALGTNSHDTQFTLDPSDIPTARDQNELARLFAAPSAYSIVSYDGSFAVKPATLATLLTCFGASMPDTGPGSGPRSNSGATNDDAAAAADDDDDGGGGGGGDGELSQTGSFRAC